jgi:hypothetical protein
MNSAKISFDIEIKIFRYHFGDLNLTTARYLLEMNEISNGFDTSFQWTIKKEIICGSFVSSECEKGFSGSFSVVGDWKNEKSSLNFPFKLHSKKASSNYSKLSSTLKAALDDLSTFPNTLKELSCFYDVLKRTLYIIYAVKTHTKCHKLSFLLTFLKDSLQAHKMES